MTRTSRNVRFGSFTTEAGKAKGPCTFASPQKRTNADVLGRPICAKSGPEGERVSAPNLDVAMTLRPRPPYPAKADAALVVSGISVRMTGMLNGEWEEVRRTLGL